MSRPIPLDIIPSHIYLSAADQTTLFGIGYPMTIDRSHSQQGQVIYKETLEVCGKNTRSLRLRVLGPAWAQSHVEVMPLEATFLGLKAPVAKSGDLSNASPCLLRGPAGEVALDHGLIIPCAHLLCSPDEANELHIGQGDRVSLDIIEGHEVLEDVLVRVHPTFSLRVEVRADMANDLWLSRSAHARLRFL